MKTGRVMLSLVLTAAAVAAAVFYARPPGSPSASETASVAAAPRTVVTALGLLEPEGKVIHVGGPSGARLDRFAEPITEGAVVSRGDPLAYLDSYPEMLAARDLAAAELQEAERRFQAETDFAQAAIDGARLKIKQAEEVLALEIDAQRAEVRRLVAERDKADKDLKRATQLFDVQTAAESQFDDAALLARRAAEQLAHGRATLSGLEQDREIKLNLARAEFRSAEAALVRAQLATRTDSLADALRLAEARLERTILRAPSGGEVLKILTRAGESVSDEPILLMGNTRSMFATAEVYETEIRLVRPGQPVRITSLALPGTLTGRIEHVSRLVRKNDLLHIDPTADTDARVLEVRVRLDDSEVAARFNHHQVDVEIRVDDSGTAAPPGSGPQPVSAARPARWIP